MSGLRNLTENKIMSFNSLSFFLYLSIIAFLVYTIPLKFRWVILLVGSYIFYAFLDIKSLTVLILSTLVDYFLAIRLGQETSHKIKKYLLLLSLTANIGLLFFLKYLDFLFENIISVISLLGLEFPLPHYEILAPVGVSFFTFKKMSYIIDVYRGECKAERHFGYFALYVSIFLEILAGPIDRAGKFIPQLKNEMVRKKIDYHGAFLLIFWGLFMKVVVADRLALYTDAVFNNVVHHSGPSLLTASYFYSFQIYCDFAGYTNIALGCGKIIGFKLMENFNLPYLSESVAEFWRRWHMSLSYWFRDYLYIPLGGNRVSTARRCLNYMAVFLLCGLWHGANLTFVIWGGIHGLMISIEYLVKKYSANFFQKLHDLARVQKAIKILVTFHLVTFSWIFFRASKVNDAIYFITHLFQGWNNMFIDSSSMAYGIGGIIIIILIDILRYNDVLTLGRFGQFHPIIRWSIYYALFFSIVLFGVESDKLFIYYQF